MQRAADTIEGVFRNLQILHFAFLISMVLYVWAAEKFIPRPPHVLKLVLPTTFGLISLWVIGIAISKRRTMIRPAIEKLQMSPDDQNALQRWKIGTILSDTLVQNVALFGFVLRVIGATPAQSAPFYATGIALMLIWWPHRP